MQLGLIQILVSLFWQVFKLLVLDLKYDLLILTRTHVNNVQYSILTFLK